MKKILYIFGFCCLLILGFSACQQEEDALVQLNLEELQKRDSKKHPKLEYITGSINNSFHSSDKKQTSKLKYTVEAKDDNLCVFFKLDSNDEVTVTFSDDLGQTFMYQSMTLKKGKEFIINPAKSYPYYFEISSQSVRIGGVITLK